VAFLRPYFNDNVGLNRLATSRGSTYDSTSEFTPSYDASPRLWLGYANACGFGGRLRYWVYDQATNPQVGVQKDSSILYFAPGIVAGVNGNTGNIETTFAGDTVTASEHLHMYTFDAEITQCLQLCCWDFTLGGGLRDAGVHIDRVNTLLPAGATVATEVADIGNHFDGVGPTVFAEFGRPFGCGGLAFVGNLRGSLLYGTKSLRGTDVSILGTQAYDNTTDGCLGVGEVSLGIEWAREISCNTKVFARGLWENQIWFNMGNSTSITGDNLGLGGFTLAAGLCR
jgi:hypothetical protein